MEAPSLASSAASTVAVTAETLSRRISNLRLAGEEYRAAFDQYTDMLVSRGLEQENVPARSHAALEQDLLNRREEEADLIEQATSQLELLKRLEEVDEEQEEGPPAETEDVATSTAATALPPEHAVNPTIRGGGRIVTSKEHTGAAWLNLVRSNQRLRQDNLRQEHALRESTPHCHEQASRRKRLEWADMQRETDLLGKLGDLEQEISGANSSMVRHLAEPDPQGQELLVAKLLELDQKLQGLKELEARGLPETSSTDQETARRAFRTAQNMDRASSALLALHRLLMSKDGAARPPSADQAPQAPLGQSFSLPALHQSTPLPTAQGVAGSSRTAPLPSLGLSSVRQDAGRSNFSGQSVSFQQGRAHLQRMALPRFEGALEDYWEFREVFHTLVANTYPEPALYLHQLKAQITQEGRNMLRGVVDKDEAWRILDQHYGDQNAAVTSIISRLRLLKPPGPAAYDKLEAVAQAVQQAVTSLNHVMGNDSILSQDFSLIGSLVDKLPSSYMDMWDNHVAAAGSLVTWSLFTSWLCKARGRARAAKNRELSTRLASGQEEKNRPAVKPPQGLGAGAVTLGTSEDKETSRPAAEQAALEATKRAKACPLCKEQGRPNLIHTYQRNFPRWKIPGYQDWPSFMIASCPAFIAMDAREREEAVLRLEICTRCGAYIHKPDACRRTAPRCTDQEPGGGVCGKRHLTVLHGGSEAVQALGIALASPRLAAAAIAKPLCTFTSSPVLLALSLVPAAEGAERVLLLADEGSQVTLIRHDTAKRIGCGPGQPWILHLQVVGDSYRPVQTKLYTVRLKDSRGKIQTLVAAGVSKISTAPASPDLQLVRKIFPEVLESTLARPSGEVDILVGACDSSLLPFGGTRVGNLRLEATPWGCGQVLRGSSPGLDLPPTPALLPEAQAASQASLHRPSGARDFCGLISLQSQTFRKDISSSPTTPPSDEDKLPNFWEAEELGARPPPQCASHRNCSDCEETLEHLSPREREAVARMEAGVTVKEGVTTVQYPWRPCVSRLEDNKYQARAVQTSIEASLRAKGRLEEFNQEMEKALTEGKFGLITPQELEARKKSGQPMNYISVFGVEQPGHAGHKLRVVANCKQKNVHAGLSVNDCVEPPPSALNPLIGVLIWFRTNLHILILDLARAYQALKTGDMEKFTCLFLWRRHPREAWATYGYDCVTFGDVCAEMALEIAKSKGADLGREIHVNTAEQLKKKVYVDDAALAAKDKQELERMKGNKREDGTYDGYISQILSKSGMAPKYIAIAGEAGAGEEAQIGGAFLGVGYSCGTDQISFSFPPVYKRKGRGGTKVEVSMSARELESLRQGQGSFTTRKALSYVMGQYDPLGLTSPISMRGKLLLRQSHVAATGWDTDLPEDVQKRWGDLVTELAEAGTVFFPRSTVPEGVQEEERPILLGFGDGSTTGFAAIVYTVWVDRQGGSKVFPVMAKARVAPLSGTTVLRMEMSSAALLARLGVLVVRSAGFTAEEVVLALDSECSVAAIRKKDGLLRPFFAHRAAEIEDAMMEMKKHCCKVSPMVAVAGQHNPADAATRDQASIVDISPTSSWQCGPRFAQLPRKCWPLKERVCEDTIPIEELRVHTVSCNLVEILEQTPHRAKEVVEETSLGPSRPFPDHVTCRRLLAAALELSSYTNSLQDATRKLALVTRALLKEDMDRSLPSARENKAALNLMYLAAAPASRSALARGDLKSLGAVKVGGEIWLGGRISPEDLAVVLGTPRLRVVMPETRMAELIMREAHEEDHRRDPRDAMARARRRCWIPRSRQLAQRVISSCFLCRRQKRSLCEQVMGELPAFKTHRSAPFTAVGCDFMGPYIVRGMCGGRRRFKVWVTVYTCFYSHATVLLGTPGYDKKTFVTTHSRFCNLYGPPDLCIVDPGPNLVAAAERPDWKEVAQASGWSNTEWMITPKGSHWRAGQVERVVGMAKQCLHRLLSGHTFTGDFHQLESLLARICWLLNSRPVAAHSVTETDFHVITPNDIILGRAARPRGLVPTQEELEEVDLPLKALTHMETVARTWHAAFLKQVWPLLVPRGKWSSTHPGVKVGDVGYIVHTSKYGKPSWQACRVLKVHPDRVGIVRTVTIGVRRRDAKKDGKLQYQAKPLSEMVVGVQRVAVTMPLSVQGLPSQAPQGLDKTSVRASLGDPEEGREADLSKSQGFEQEGVRRGIGVMEAEEEGRKMEDFRRGPGVEGEKLEEDEAVPVPAKSLFTLAPGLAGWQGGRAVEEVTDQGQEVHLQHGLLPLPSGLQRKSRRQQGQGAEYIGI